MCHCPIAQCRTTERCFHRVAVRDAQHPYNNATGAFFIALNFEFTTLEGKLLLPPSTSSSLNGGSKLKLTRWRISDKRCDALRANEHKMIIKRTRRFQNHSKPHLERLSMAMTMAIPCRQHSCAASEGTPARTISYRAHVCFHSHKWICYVYVNVRAYRNTSPHHTLRSVFWSWFLCTKSMDTFPGWQCDIADSDLCRWAMNVYCQRRHRPDSASGSIWI